MKTILVDLSRCNGCYNCQIACKDEHCENDWSPIAKPEPITGQFWCKVNQKERGRVPVVRVDYTPTFCGMCDQADCLASSKNGAVYRRDDGLVIIDPHKAKGQKQIADSCPLGMIYWNDELQIPQKCTGCAHLIDNGWDVPRCVDACSTGALRYGDVEDFAEELGCAIVSKELEGKGSHIYYINKTGRFVAGTVADRALDEVVIGAKANLFGADGSLVAQVETDEFGDFRFGDVPEGAVRVVVEAEGYKPVELESTCIEDDIVFDDVFVEAV